MKRLNARGLAAANKMLMLAATCYNLEKWLKFTSPGTNIKAMAIVKTKAGEAFALIKTMFARLIAKQNAAINFSIIHHC